MRVRGSGRSDEPLSAYTDRHAHIQMVIALDPQFRLLTTTAGFKTESATLSIINQNNEAQGDHLGEASHSLKKCFPCQDSFLPDFIIFSDFSVPNWKKVSNSLAFQTKC